MITLHRLITSDIRLTDQNFLNANIDRDENLSLIDLDFITHREAKTIAISILNKSNNYLIKENCDNVELQTFKPQVKVIKGAGRFLKENSIL